MRIVVTGATGFLGTALCRELVSAGHNVLPLSTKTCDLKDAKSLAVTATWTFDRIFHLAAWTQAGDFCLRHPGEQWIINQQINTNVLAWWKEFQPQAKMICIGTSCAYDERLPHIESNYLVGEPTPSLFTYAMTKRMLCVGLRSLAQQFDLSYLQVVPSTLYGPGYHTDGRQMHFIFDLMRKILLAKRTGEPAVLWGDGHQRREIVHVDDFVRATLALADNVSNEIVNISTGEDHSIREFADLICKLVDCDPALVEYDTSKYVGAKAKLLRNEKLLGLLPGFEFCSLESGLKSTLDWMRQAFVPSA